MAAEGQSLLPEAVPPHAARPTHQTASVPQSSGPTAGCPPHTPSYGTAAEPTVIVHHAQPLPQTVPVYQMKPPNHVGFSIVILLFFCPVCAVLALVSAVQVDQAWASGDRDAARRKSVAARNWNIVGLIVGVLLYLSATIAVVVSVTVVY